MSEVDVDRLRRHAHDEQEEDDGLIEDAADEIERLRDQLDHALDALRASHGGCRIPSVGDECDCGLCKRDRQITDLQAIVGKLPKTADGVPVTPGMDLWSVDGGGCYQWLVEAIKSNGVVSGSFHNQTEGPHDAESCYFTRKAAEAAKP